tara:strand:+ start:82 stop:213 length:132 start_codon:yes stop_codon:yes gene_type:complete
MVSKGTRLKPKSIIVEEKKEKKVIGFMEVCAKIESIIMGNGKN